MSLLRPLPDGTTHVLSRGGIAFLPPFVSARLAYLADVFEWWPDEVEQGNEPNAPLFTYHEVHGMLSDGFYSSSSGEYVCPIHFWMGSDDNCTRSLHLGGSSCWVCPTNDELFFDAIDPQLLPPHPELKVWWDIHYEGGIKVVKIVVNPPATLTEHFPDAL